MNGMNKHLYYFALGFFTVNLFWALGYLLTGTPVIPSPWTVYAQTGKLLQNNILLHIALSLKRIGLGLLLSLAVGIPVGILMAYSKIAGAVLRPFVYFTYPIPKTALLPIAMFLWGMHDGSKVAILFLIIVFQAMISVRDGIESIDPAYYLVTVSAGASRMQIIRHVTLPAVLPALMTSLRISIATAVAVLFFAEGYGTRYGMGYYILDAWSRLDYAGMYAGILVISVVGYWLFASIDMLSKRLYRWR
ncbi:MAG TPA: ABC transporter permease [Candidatus Limiplasma sp.]|nr:ABC transporter permease [Candidatus Limiplasma sp.]